MAYEIANLNTGRRIGPFDTQAEAAREAARQITRTRQLWIVVTLDLDERCRVCDWDYDDIAFAPDEHDAHHAALRDATKGQ